MSQVTYETHAPHLDKPIEAKDILGLGDAVALVAQPIARVIDRVAGTNIQNCGGCKQRQEMLNRLVSNIKINLPHG
jgi:hypothetical protein